jgi:hypothetical protein
LNEGAAGFARRGLWGLYFCALADAVAWRGGDPRLCSLSRRPMPGGYEKIEASAGQHDDISDSVALSLTICHQRQACNHLLAPVMRADGRIMPYADALLEGYQELLLDYRQRQMERMYHG